MGGLNIGFIKKITLEDKNPQFEKI